MTPLLTVKEVSAILRCGHTYVYTLIARGDLPVVKLDRLTRIPASALNEFIEARTQQARLEDLVGAFANDARG